jgi:Asp-tRNA(Asn)/Glu-tRNA(Gln) amidotransferase A subunit family amidase
MNTPPGLVQACSLIQNQGLDAKKYLAEAIAQAEITEPQVKAFLERASLAQLSSQIKAGPLSGIPIAVKDIIATRDFPTTCGSPIYAGKIPKNDATIIAKIRDLGGVIFGKTVTTEFAWRKPGPTTNPWNAEHTPGGSSSGSAAAVASKVVPLALGSQTIGSIIRPAAFCGVVGFKASFGAVPRTGVFPVSKSLDHVGFFTRSVADAAYAFNLLKNETDAEADSIVIPQVSIEITNYQPRIAILNTPYDHLLSPEQVHVLSITCDALSKAGASIQEITLPQKFWDAMDATFLIMACEAAIVHEMHLNQCPELLGKDIKELIQKGRDHTPQEYAAALALQIELRDSIGKYFSSYDAFLSAPATGEAPKGLSSTGDPIFCWLWSLLGIPAITLPISTSSNGLPLGVQLISNYRQDETLLKVAAFTERAVAEYLQPSTT